MARDVRGFSRPVAIVAFFVPAIVVIAGIVFPAVYWSRLPRSRPGPLVVSFVILALGTIRLAREGLHLRDLRREPFTPEPLDPGRPDVPVRTPGVSGLVLDWIWAKLGPVAVGLFVVGVGTSWSVGMTEASLGSTTFQWPGGGYTSGDAGTASGEPPRSLAILTARRRRRTGGRRRPPPAR